MNLDKKRWIVLAASCLINLCIGSIYAWSVFSAPLAAKLTALLGHAVTAADLAIVFTVANAVGPITLISGGYPPIPLPILSGASPTVLRLFNGCLTVINR